MRDTTLLARALDIKIPDADLARVRQALEGLEASFAPLRASLRPEIEPAVMFRAAEETE